MITRQNFRRGYRLVFLVLLTGILIPSGMQGQDFYDIPGFLRKMGTSQNSYEFSILDGRIREMDDHTNLNFNYYYIDDSSGIKQVTPYVISREARELSELGWEALMIEEPDSALVFYSELLEMYPLYSPAITGKGQAWQIKGDLEKAVDQYRKAIQINPIDYLAYWHMAIAQDLKGEKDSAVHYILYAWILNRNSLSIKLDVDRFLKGAGKKFHDWFFVPQYVISKEKDKIHIEYHVAWMGYAVCQAVWTYEPGFAELRQIDGDKGMFRERECLSCLVTSMESDVIERDKDPALIAFRLSLKEKMALEFILFEIMLREKPDMALFLDDARVSRLINYITKTRIL